ncbi:Disease resistance protein RGA2 [Vitis vinifera]|uniref:Disease resistance protein RGA2 n=1 Tax=Vitis vinifera TaxID=29760 RepID=A0A438BQN2_VITVI|nr:Disease resistance protein RGA2 [Vitis vinifera]
MAGALVGGAFLSASLQVLFDRMASREQIANPAVRGWVDELKHAVYDAEDLLDEIATEALRCKIEAESQTSTVQEIIDRLEFLGQQKDVLGLKEGAGEKLSQRWPTTSLVDESRVYGRNGNKEEIIELLLSDDASCDEICLITILAWAVLARPLLLNLCTMIGKLQTPLRAGAKGSKIIVTTRNENVASIMGASCTHHLGQLSLEDCWFIFSKHAFQNGDTGARPNLEAIGKEIVKKCQGLPLAAKTLGGLLCSKLEAEEWDNILKSKKSGSRIRELRELPLIRGRLCISKLQNVVSARDALKANLKDKKYLDELVLVWSYGTEVLQNGIDIISKLQPHTNLKRLTIDYYGGEMFQNGWEILPS